MFKNVVIAILLSALWHSYMCEFKLMTFICFASVMFFAVWGIEEAVDRLKSRKALQRKFNKDVNKITLNTPTKAS